MTIVSQRIVSLKDSIAQAHSSANEETKSSAGDKYETGRAMAQLEIEKMTVQLSEAEQQKGRLDEINLSSVSSDVRRGTLVTTNQGNFYIAIAVGPVTIDNEKYFVISPQSPIAKAMIGRRQSDVVTFNSKEYLINAVL